MNSIEKISDVNKSMNCESTDKTLVELEKDGWKDAWSFHTRFRDQWNQACDKVAAFQNEGLNVLLVGGQNEAERNDGVAYLYIKEKAE